MILEDKFNLKGNASLRIYKDDFLDYVTAYTDYLIALSINRQEKYPLIFYIKKAIQMSSKKYGKDNCPSLQEIMKKTRETYVKRTLSVLEKE